MKIQDLFRSRRQPSSGEIARERLRLVLAYDRAQISPGLLDTLKDEIIAVISRYVAIDAEGVEVTFTEGPRLSRLTANIPLHIQRGGRSK